jgi:hypothetical protein
MSVRFPAAHSRVVNQRFATKLSRLTAIHYLSLGVANASSLSKDVRLWMNEL